MRNPFLLFGQNYPHYLAGGSDLFLAGIRNIISSRGKSPQYEGVFNYAVLYSLIKINYKIINIIL